MVNRNLKVTTIGGGTGHSHLISGLKDYFDDLVALVAVSDNGGNSGFLRENFDIVPPGDIRACLSAFSNNDNLKKIMNYRFEDGILNGQSLGNLILVAMSKINGDFLSGIKEISKTLDIKGKVYPISLDNINIVAEFTNGEIIKGETEISNFRIKNNRINRIFIDPLDSKPLQLAVDRIYESDIIILAPGSLFTSIIPNLIFEDIKEAFKNTKAKIYYVMNIMTQSFETFNFRPLDHINMILKHCEGIKLDTVFINNGVISKELLEKYKLENSVPVKINDFERNTLNEMGIKIIEDDFIQLNKGVIRHNVKLLLEKL